MMRPAQKNQSISLPDSPKGSVDELIKGQVSNMRQSGAPISGDQAKRQFVFQKTRFRGMMKNCSKVDVLAAL
jgi:hypothetical protein